MRCPTCGAVSLVKETRSSPDGVRRRRECFNLHLFTTIECYEMKGRRTSEHWRRARKVEKARKILREKGYLR